MSTLHILASVVGYLGVALLFVQITFGSRHIFSFFTKDNVFINKIHKFIGIYGTLLIFSHPFFEMMWREDSLLWIVTPHFSNQFESSLSFGRFALFLLVILWLTSAIMRESIKWRPWKYTHLIAYPLIFLVLFHTPGVGSFFADYTFIRVIWYVLFWMFIVSLLYRLVAWSGVTKKKGKVLKRDMQGDSLLILTLSFPKGMKDPEIGQHVYLQARSFGSEHPFTVMEFDKEKGEITFGMRAGGVFVESLKTIQVGSSLFIDGPYGLFTKEAWNTDEKVIIAGGVGVTPFVRLVEKYGKNTTFLYCNRSVHDALRKETIKKNVTLYKDVIELCEEPIPSDTVVGRLSYDALETILGEKLRRLPYFICGSPLFIASIRKMLKDIGVSKHKIFFEELGF